MLNSYQISPKIDDIVKGTFFSNLHANLDGTLRSNFASQKWATAALPADGISNANEW